MIADVLSDTPLSKLSTDILIADGTPLKVYGTQEVHFSMQGMLFDHTIVVADLNVDRIRLKRPQTLVGETADGIEEQKEETLQEQDHTCRQHKG